MLRSATPGRWHIVTLLSSVGLMVVLALAVSAPPAAVGQATRTWVSGVGDDVNPCSRTAPCKTFAGAISKTAAGGEINCLDPGGFGAVTITKSMTISCLYTEGGALAGGNGVVVNAQPTDVVYLRGLDIFGVNPPTNGIRFIAGAALHVDNVQIRRFNASGSFGISFQPGGASELFVSNSIIADNGNTAAANGGGVLIQPTGAGGSAKVTFVNTSIQNNNFHGLRVDTTGATNAAGVDITISGCTATGNLSHGFAAVAVGSPIDMMIDSSVSSFNGSGGSGSGIVASGATALVRVGSSTITGNVGGTSPVSSGVIESYGNNQIDGNTSDGSNTNIPLD